MTTDLEAMEQLLNALKEQKEQEKLISVDLIFNFMEHAIAQFTYQQNLVKLLLKDEPQIKGV